MSTSADGTENTAKKTARTRRITRRKHFRISSAQKDRDIVQNIAHLLQVERVRGQTARLPRTVSSTEKARGGDLEQKTT